MAPDADAPSAADPLAVLERVVRGLGDELAFFRRRALEAERRLRDMLAQQSAAATAAASMPGAAAAPASSEADRTRMAALEAENAELRARIAEAAERTRAVTSRIRFARQQDDAAAAEGTG